MKTFYAIVQPINIKVPTAFVGGLCSFNKKATRDEFVKIGSPAGGIAKDAITHENSTILAITAKQANSYKSNWDYSSIEA